MGTIKLEFKDEQIVKLQEIAKLSNISVNKLMEDFSTAALSQFDAEMRFRSLAKGGSRDAGLKVLDKLDKAFSSKAKSNK